MKKFAMLTMLAAVYHTSYCQIEKITQAEDQAIVTQIINLMEQKDYLGAIEELNAFIPRYSNIGNLYIIRAAARFGLNDYQAARKDLLLARGAGFRGQDEYINIFTSRKAMAEKMMKETKLEGELDSLRGYKIKIRPADTLQGGLRPERTCFDVNFYDLSVKILPETKSIEGSNAVYFTAVSGSGKIQLDLFPDFEISSISMDGRDLKFDRLFGAVFVDPGSRIVPGERYKIVISYKGSPRIAPKPPWNGGFVWEKDKGRYHVGVACEHLGASSWWPLKDHLSDKPDSMRINLQVPAGYMGISNGNLRSHKDLGNGYTNFEWFVSYPINSYNVTVYMGDFVNFSETIANSIGSYPVDYYVLQKNLDKSKKYYAQTKEIIAVYEKLFGEYPFMRDGAGMVEAPFEGMEHQGAIAIGGGYGKGQGNREMYPEGYDYLLVHETGHEWWGNAVAIGDMADAWINEGFTTYAECLFAEEKSGYADYIKMIASKQRIIFNLHPIVGERNINENTFLTGDIYNKGAAMLNNLRCIIDNDTLFMRIIKDYYQKYRYKITNTADFVNLVSEYTGMNLGDFFRKFLYESEPPVLVCTYSLDKGNLSFSYRWMNTGARFTLPFCICLNGKEVIRLNATSSLQTYKAQKVKSFFVVNENNLPDRLEVPKNCFTYYYTSWPML
jgi:aminopeptidase N